MLLYGAAIINLTTASVSHGLCDFLGGVMSIKIDIFLTNQNVHCNVATLPPRQQTHPEACNIYDGVEKHIHIWIWKKKYLLLHVIIRSSV